MKIFVKQTDSTNKVAKEKAVSGAATETVIWAEQQGAGQGQYGRVFASPVGGLYFSLLLRLGFSPEIIPLITLMAGLACREVLFEQYSLDVRIKWPNDLYIDGKKVGGILCENSFDSANGQTSATVIVGVGLNVNSRLHDFPTELQSLVTTIYEKTLRLSDLEMLLDRLTAKIAALVAQLPTNRDSLLDRWQNYDYLLHKPLRYINGEQTLYGTGLGIAPDGRYRMLDEIGHEHAIIGGQVRPAED